MLKISVRVKLIPVSGQSVMLVSSDPVSSPAVGYSYFLRLSAAAPFKQAPINSSKALNQSVAVKN